jgi:hypothetical protein
MLICRRTFVVREEKQMRTLFGGLRHPRLRCGFCGRNENEVGRLVAGTSAFICDNCIGKCVVILQEHGRFEPPRQRADTQGVK